MDTTETFNPAEVTLVDDLELAHLPTGTHFLGVNLVVDALGRDEFSPVTVLKGAKPGPVVGFTAAVHGNELNGIPTIHRLFKTIDIQELAGTLVGVNIVNVPGFLRYERRLPDGRDLNRIMPGRPDGRESSVYAHRLSSRILHHFDVLIDLHTASFGRVNTLYVRADLKNPETAKLARSVGAEILVHNEGSDGTLRAELQDRGVPAITIEIGDPQIIDRDKVKMSRIGLRDAIEELGLVPPDAVRSPLTPIECARSFWLYTDTGGILDVKVGLGERVTAGELVATLVDPWGRMLRKFRAPQDAVVVGKSTNPVAPTGARIVHLGIEGLPSIFPPADEEE